MPVHPNDKQAQIKAMRKNMRRLQNYQKNPAVMDALARSALEVARDRIEELEEEVRRLRNPPPTIYHRPCFQHEKQTVTLAFRATAFTALGRCFICEPPAEA